MLKKYKILSIFLPLILGTLVAFLTTESTSIYSSFSKPPFSPPAIVFPIVWSILYILIGLSYTILPDTNEEIDKLYFTSLLVNLVWPLFFFRFSLYCVSVIILIILIYLVIKLMLEYKKIYDLSFYLMIPYLLWLFLALYLNIGVCILN
ncbi:MAG: tryptophan-rich sensory protein [Bacilli bacterium]|nr:tryptophan-rich sensory protein [Bacilli bacterium]